ncbi:hypothetical protein HYG81_20110 (plasmid) [Natrinema zhouii]|uniref:hypothetical protein n=1 Tax=Natrinema zhouii TaxID=1710539 RepID=UPI001CFFFC72|nr:hypothetical protein [Natrinema zhouii]UHQ98367.1 hypothetical protein HYG81_20110 [Natrinema zhouii]
MADADQTDESLTPAQRLESSNPRIIDAGVATITDMETLQACVAYENQHQQRLPILKQLGQRAEELREES